MPELFDYIRMISQTKIMPEFDDEFEKKYNIFMVNRFFSLYFDTSILIAQLINKNSPIPKKAHFLYLYHMVRKGKRFAKWPKPQLDKDVELIQVVFKYNHIRAKEALLILTKDELQKIRDSQNNKGGAF